MKLIVRMTQRFVAGVAADLERKHPVAAERLGFVLARWARAGDHLLLFPVDYRPVADDHYINDPSVGATINSAAVRVALQATLDSGAACLHVHLHPPEMPYFGKLDLAEQEKLIPSFTATNPRAPHGALLLFGHEATARIWPPGGGAPIMASRLGIVGYPLQLSEWAP